MVTTGWGAKPGRWGRGWGVTWAVGTDCSLSGL